MPISDGDYITIEESVRDAILADDAEGGLFEAGAEAVSLVETGLRGELRLYRDHEIPAVAVVVVSRDERIEANAPMRSFRIALEVYCRGADRIAEGAKCRKIASRLEEILRAENASDRQLGGLPASLAWSIGAMTVTPMRTEFRVDNETKRGRKTYSVSATVEAVLDVPAKVY